MQPLSKLSQGYFTIVCAFYHAKGLSTGPLFKENRHAYEWLIYCRRIARQDVTRSQNILKSFSENGVPEEILLGEGGFHISSAISIEKRCDQLRSFYETHGHYKVPLRSSDGLGKWLQRTKEIYKTEKGKSNQRVIAILNSFCSKVLAPTKTKFNDKSLGDEVWEKFFKMLSLYKKNNKHCNVPRRSSDVGDLKKLGVWVYKQRMAFRSNKLTENRKEKLLEIGFEFKKS